MNDSLEIRIYGDASLPTLIYLPGLHGDWTLCSPFRRRLLGQVRMVKFAYPKQLPWTLAEHATAVGRALEENDIHSGWLLGESFGSQILWALLKAGNPAFKAEGIILVGGFVRYPIIPLVQFAQFLFAATPGCVGRGFLKIYVAYAAVFREMTKSDAEELMQRQKNASRETFRHRLRLIEESDPKELARKTTCPIYHLTGLIDPIVPWFLVRPWLRKNCPSFAGSKMLWADHNVLGSASAGAAKQVLEWMECKK